MSFDKVVGGKVRALVNRNPTVEDVKAVVASLKDVSYYCDKARYEERLTVEELIALSTSPYVIMLRNLVWGSRAKNRLPQDVLAKLESNVLVGSNCFWSGDVRIGHGAIVLHDGDDEWTISLVVNKHEDDWKPNDWAWEFYKNGVEVTDDVTLCKLDHYYDRWTNESTFTLKVESKHGFLVNNAKLIGVLLTDVDK